MQERWLFALLTLALTSAQQVSAREVILRLHGSNTIGAELGPALARQWLERRGVTGIRYEGTALREGYLVGRDPNGREVAVEIKAHGSSTAFAGLASGAADVGMASRPVKSHEVQILRPAKKVLHARSEYVVGLDGIAVVVPPGNPLNALDTAQLRKVFSGEVRNWRELGGRPGAIRVYARDDKSGTFDTFRHLVLGKKAALVGDARRFESNAELSHRVSEDPNGIGFVGLPYVRTSKALAVGDPGTVPIRPDAFTVATEDYALARRLYLYVPEQGARPEAVDFAEFAVSRAGQGLVADNGFVSQEILAARPELKGPHEYLELTQGAERLSLNFRFREGSAELDTKAVRDIERLVQFMEAKQGKRELLLVGFADANEAIPMHSLALSVSRADVIADRLLNFGVAASRVRGYGAAVPVASNESRGGRQKNRRVEVWIR